MLPDTNVIIAASVHVTSVASDIVVTEPHHEESGLLLDALLNRKHRVRCVVLPTVAVEVARVTRRAASRAVLNAFREQCGKKGWYGTAEMDRMITTCVDRSILLVSSMTRCDPPPHMVEVHLADVDKMAGEIRRRYGDMAAESLQSDAAQFERFLQREPAKNSMDERILAEAASARDIFCAGRDGPEELCIASNDMGIFAPLTLRDGRVSRPIIDMIRDRFAITCGLPRDIRALCTGP